MGWCLWVRTSVPNPCIEYSSSSTRTHCSQWPTRGIHLHRIILIKHLEYVHNNLQEKGTCIRKSSASTNPHWSPASKISEQEHTHTDYLHSIFQSKHTPTMFKTTCRRRESAFNIWDQAHARADHDYPHAITHWSQRPAGEGHLHLINKEQAHVLTNHLHLIFQGKHTPTLITITHKQYHTDHNQLQEKRTCNLQSVI
jgi:hypothetical protein